MSCHRPQTLRSWQAFGVTGEMSEKRAGSRRVSNTAGPTTEQDEGLYWFSISTVVQAEG